MRKREKREEHPRSVTDLTCLSVIADAARRLNANALMGRTNRVNLMQETIRSLSTAAIEAPRRPAVVLRS